MSETATIRNFAQLISVAEDGELNSDLDQEITDLVAALNDAGASRGGKAKGKITLSVELVLDGGIISMTTDYVVKKPKIPRARSAFWTTPDNKLSRRNPKQSELPLRDVSAPSEIRSV